MKGCLSRCIGTDRAQQAAPLPEHVNKANQVQHDNTTLPTRERRAAALRVTLTVIPEDGRTKEPVNAVVLEWRWAH